MEQTNYSSGRQSNSTTEGLKGAAESIQQGLGQVAESVKKECVKVGENVAEYADRAAATAKDKGTVLVGNVEEYVKEKPLQSMLTVAAAGYLLGRMFRH